MRPVENVLNSKNSMQAAAGDRVLSSRCCCKIFKKIPRRTEKGDEYLVTNCSPGFCLLSAR